MRKLNRKGFTLIELLAVIVILAIVLVVTIPSVIKAMNSAKEKQLKNAADSVAEWFQKNYDLDNLPEIATGVETGYSTFMAGKNWITTNEDVTTYIPLYLCVEDSETHIITCQGAEAAGLSSAVKNITTSSYVKVDSKGKICVHLEAAEGGSFYVNGGTNSVNGGRGTNCS